MRLTTPRRYDSEGVSCDTKEIHVGVCLAFMKKGGLKFVAHEPANSQFETSILPPHMYTIFSKLVTGLLFLSFLSTVYLYSYPVFHRCAFVKQPAPLHSAYSDAPFRLLALGDPQLEGDSSLLDFHDGYFPSVQTLKADLAASSSLQHLIFAACHSLQSLIVSDVPNILRSYRKRLDLWGNDYYLAHIYRTLHWFTNPTHVAVLGDLLGSQWVSDEEFERRGQRYWNRVFRHGRRVDDHVTNDRHLDILGRDKSWESRIINIVGNHDVGYAGDMTLERMQRFERVFGKANWEIRFALQEEHHRDTLLHDNAKLPELRIVVLNSLNLDTPALSEDLQAETYEFMNDVIAASRPVEDRTTATVVLTHLPLHKEAGVCVDGPYFDFHCLEQGGGVKEQNHLSYNAGKGILEGIFGMSGNPNAPAGGFGRNGVIITGHDHEGCDVYHSLPENDLKDSRTWKAERWDDSGLQSNDTLPGIREITLRSMMGDFGGSAGLMSAWFDHGLGEWRIEYQECLLGLPHIWWAIHVVDIITIGLILIVRLDLIGKGKPIRKLPKELPVDEQVETSGEYLHQGSNPALDSNEGEFVSDLRLRRRL